MSKQLRGGYNVIFMNKKRYVVHVNVEAKKKNTSQKIYVCQSSDENTI